MAGLSVVLAGFDSMAPEVASGSMRCVYYATLHGRAMCKRKLLCDVRRGRAVCELRVKRKLIDDRRKTMSIGFDCVIG